ncbi:MAG: hypothetical protein J6P74_01665 [Paludibacteraceae bacterium]|nr:hypothetical protein [Paludibacteraceae bacterium]
MLAAYPQQTAQQHNARMEPFLIGNLNNLDIWSNDYFLQIAGMIRFA